MERHDLNPHHSFRDLFVGIDAKIPIADGTERPYVNLDAGASTPALKSVQDIVNSFLPYYSSVHRGSGYKSLISTHAFEQARSGLLHFLNADAQEHICIFVKNTTEAINKLARRFPFTKERDVLITTAMEHHSDDLPWRACAPHVVHIAVTPQGTLDMADLDAKLSTFHDHVALVAITGASNVTGYLNPIHEIAEKVHAIGAQIMVDCAQLVAHRKIDMKPLDHPQHLDYVAISGHKMYAPFGTGALVGRKDTFSMGEPDMPGGGTVALVTPDNIWWAPAPDRDEAGSPNTVGAVALLAAIRTLESIGMDVVASHESILTGYALSKLQTVPGIRIFGDNNPSTSHTRVGAIPFILEGIHHHKIAAILGHEFGIGVRSGCFCAHPYLVHLLGVSDEAKREMVHQRIVENDSTRIPGLIRCSFGLYNTTEDVNALVDALIAIQKGEYKATYVQSVATGEFTPLDCKPAFEKYLPLPLGLPSTPFAPVACEPPDPLADRADSAISKD
ncbi:hypothetical protein HK102_006625, partial [Quaeritorhiza haematococci]